MRAKRSAAAPLVIERASNERAAFSSFATLPSTMTSAPSANVTSISRASVRSPRSIRIASCTSSALPAERASGSDMSVSSADIGRPAAAAVEIIARASSRPRSGSGSTAPLPNLMSSTSASSPAASFFERMDATMSGRQSTVAVTSRIA